MVATAAKIRIQGMVLVGLVGMAVWMPRPLRASETGNPAMSTASTVGDLPSSLSLPSLPRASAPVVAQQPFPGLIEDTHLDKTPPRKTKGLDLVKLGWTYNCMECHQFLKAQWHYTRPMVEHQDIHLQHGNNRFCLNCHHPTNRNAFVDYDGSEIAEKDVVLLCAKCHGPTYRDWKAGVHGRRNGYWDTRRGPQTQLRCIQCHDPHRPLIQPMEPQPPPRYPERAPDTRESRDPHDLHPSPSGQQK